MVKMKKWTIILLALSLVAVVAVPLLVNRNESVSKDPFDRQLELYLNAAKKSTKKSAAYAYFPSDEIRNAHLMSGGKILDYKVESKADINDRLREYTTLVETNQEPGSYTRYYYFVGNIDGQMKFIVNAAFVPEEISENLDVAQYSYGADLEGDVFFEDSGTENH